MSIWIDTHALSLSELLKTEEALKTHSWTYATENDPAYLEFLVKEPADPVGYRLDKLLALSVKSIGSPEIQSILDWCTSCPVDLANTTFEIVKADPSRHEEDFHILIRGSRKSQEILISYGCQSEFYGNDVALKDAFDGALQLLGVDGELETLKTADGINVASSSSNWVDADDIEFGKKEDDPRKKWRLKCIKGKHGEVGLTLIGIDFSKVIRATSGLVGQFKDCDTEASFICADFNRRNELYKWISNLRQEKWKMDFMGLVPDGEIDLSTFISQKTRGAARLFEIAIPRIGRGFVEVILGKESGYYTFALDAANFDRGQEALEQLVEEVCPGGIDQSEK